MKADNFYESVWDNWSQMVDNSPAPRHRRRIVRSIVRPMAGQISSVCDVGCGNGALLRELFGEYGRSMRLTGYDISSSVISQNAVTYDRYDNFNWGVLDLACDPIREVFDLVVCCEVLEHLEDWKKGLETLIGASRKYVIVSVPSGRIFKIDEQVGHKQHFSRKMLESYFRSAGNLSYRIFFWGFPFHVLYKHLINLSPGRISGGFLKEQYSWKEKVVCNLLDGIFFLNARTSFQTNQLFLVIEKNNGR